MKPGEYREQRKHELEEKIVLLQKNIEKTNRLFQDASAKAELHTLQKLVKIDRQALHHAEEELARVHHLDTQQEPSGHKFNMAIILVGIVVGIIVLLLAGTFKYYPTNSSALTGLVSYNLRENNSFVHLENSKHEIAGTYTLTPVADGKKDIAITIPIHKEWLGITVAEPDVKVRLHDVQNVRPIQIKMDSNSQPLPAAITLNTPIIAAEDLQMSSALVQLPKRGNIEKIFHCAQFDYAHFSCANWEATAISFTDHGNYIEFEVPHFSAYAAGEIVAIDAVHLESNYNFISNIFQEVKAKDDQWSESITKDELVRVTFERDLTNGRMIDLYARSSGQPAHLDIYEAGTTHLVGKSGEITEPGWQYITVNNLQAPHDQFDFKIVTEEPVAAVEFDYIHDNIISSSQADGMLVYGALNNASAISRGWNQNYNFSQINRSQGLGTNGTNDIQWVVLRGSWKRDEMIMGTQDAASDINFQIFNNSDSNSPWQQVLRVADNVASPTRRAFDIAYEELTGHAFLVYENNSPTDQQIQYQLWNGTRYSAVDNFTVTDPTGATLGSTPIYNILAFPKLKSDDIMILAVNSSSSAPTGLLAALFNGTGVLPSNTLVISNRTDFNIRPVWQYGWESLSGEGIVVWGASKALLMRTYSTSGGWSETTNIANITAGAITVNGLRLCSNPSSDYIGVIWIDGNLRVNVSMWNGSEILNSTPTISDGAAGPANGNVNMDCAFFNQTSALFGFIAKANVPEMFYFTFSEINSWNTTTMASASLPNITLSAVTNAAIKGLKFTRHPVKNELMIVTQDASGDTYQSLWYGNQTRYFHAIGESPAETYLEITDGSAQTVWFDWFRYDPRPNVTDVRPTLNSAATAGTTIEISANVTDNLLLIFNDTIPMQANITFPNGTNLTFVLSNSTAGAGSKFNLTFTIPSATMPSSTGLYTVSFFANDSRNSLNWSEKTNFTVDAATSEGRLPLLISSDIINLSSGTASQGGGFVISSTTNGFTNGTSLSATFTGSTGLSVVNVSTGVININVSLIRNSSHGNYPNVTFGWMLAKSNGSTMLNTTIQNNTFNQSAFNYSFSAALLPDGIYNISVYTENISEGATRIVNYSRGFDIAIDRTPPNVTVWTNYSGVYYGIAFNLSLAKLEINVTSNDSTTYTQSVVFTINSSNGTGFNITASRNASGFVAELDTRLLTQGLTYTIIPISNDSLGNHNRSAVNITFIVDTVAPPITAFWMNMTDANTQQLNVSSSMKLLFNITVNDTTLSVQDVRLSFNNSRNNTGFNVTATKNTSNWAVEVDTALLTDGIYTPLIHVNDTVDNRNRSVANLTFALDRTPPPVTVWTNYSGVYYSLAFNLSGASKLEINVSSNDSTTYTQAVVFTINSSNGTGFNVTTTRNSSAFVGVLDTALLTEGVYTIVPLANDSLGNTNRSAVNITFTVDRTAPPIAAFWMNLTDANSATSLELNISSARHKILFNATINDSTLTVQDVRVGFYSSRNNTGFNITATKNTSNYGAEVDTALLSEGVYTVRISVNDTVDNRNNTVANLTIRLDSTPPNVTLFFMNTSNATSYAFGTVTEIQINATLNDSTTFAQAVKFGVLSVSNGTEFNITPTKSGSYWTTNLALGTLTSGSHIIRLYGNDSLGNLNNSVSNLSFTLSSNTPPTASAYLQIDYRNLTTTTNRTPIFIWQNSSDADGDVISYQLQVDDNALFNNPEINVSSIQSLVSSPVNTTYFSSIGTAELTTDTTYYWRVRANDSTGYGTWSNGAAADGPGSNLNNSNFTVSSLLQFTFSNNRIDFGTLTQGANSTTANGDPLPFRAQNTGNINMNISINASPYFQAVQFNTSYYQFRFRANESNSFDTALSAVNWTNMSNRTDKQYLINLTWRDIRNDFLMDLNISIPSDEPSGIHNSTITFTVVSNE